MMEKHIRDRLTRMKFYVFVTEDGLYHVQNMVGPFFGQHHIHDKTGFEKWKKNLSSENLKDLDVTHGAICDCGLKAGESKNGF